MSTPHTPGPWKIMADPILAGRDPFHDFRYITTADTRINLDDCDALSTEAQLQEAWFLDSGELICSMRDTPGAQQANARLISAAPELKACLVAMLTVCPTTNPDGASNLPLIELSRAALAKARGETP